MANQIIKEARAKLKSTQAFFTVDEVCEKLLGHLAADFTLAPGMRVLEPEAGDGNLVEWLRGPGMEVYAIELDRENCDRLVQRHRMSVLCADFLGIEPDYFGFLFDAVVMNPPFSNGQDMTHVMHAFRFLAPGGTLLAVISPAFKTLSTKAATHFRAFVGEHGGILEELPKGTFKESGTMVSTVIIRLVKPE